MLHIDVSDNVLIGILHYNLFNDEEGPIRQKTKKILHRLLLNVAMIRDGLSWCYVFFTSSRLTIRHTPRFPYQLFYAHTTFISKRLLYMHVLESVFSLFYNGICVFLLRVFHFSDVRLQHICSRTPTPYFSCISNFKTNVR